MLGGELSQGWNISGCERACGQREIDTATASSERFKTRNNQQKKKPKECCYQQPRISTGARIKELVYKQRSQIAPQRNDLQKKPVVWNFERAPRKHLAKKRLIRRESKKMTGYKIKSKKAREQEHGQEAGGKKIKKEDLCALNFDEAVVGVSWRGHLRVAASTRTRSSRMIRMVLRRRDVHRHPVPCEIKRGCSRTTTSSVIHVRRER